MSQESFPPGMMLRSFLTVSSSLVLTVVSSIAAMFGIGMTCFPEAFQAILDNDLDVTIPSLMFWSAVLLTVLACLAIGYYIVKTAPFSHFAHAIFVAVLLFIYYLQNAIGADTPSLKSMMLVSMIAYPMAILVGAQWTINRIVRKLESEDATLTGES